MIDGLFVKQHQLLSGTERGASHGYVGGRPLPLPQHSSSLAAFVVFAKAVLKYYRTISRAHSTPTHEITRITGVGRQKMIGEDGRRRQITDKLPSQRQ